MKKTLAILLAGTAFSFASVFTGGALARYGREQLQLTNENQYRNIRYFKIGSVLESSSIVAVPSFMVATGIYFLASAFRKKKKLKKECFYLVSSVKIFLFFLINIIEVIM